jgi:hypothetical protein
LRLASIFLPEKTLAEMNEHSDIAGAGTLHLQIDDFGFAETAAALEADLKFRLFEATLKRIAAAMRSASASATLRYSKV